MSTEEIIQKTKEIFISKDYRLMDKNYRCNMNKNEKMKLVLDMIMVARKLQFFYNFR